jgi:DNA polymerase III subunit beta
MKIILLQENLRSALTHVSKAVPSKPQLAILGSVYLKVHPTHLELAATDLYLGIRSQVLGTTETEGTLVVPGKVFQEVIGSLPPGKISLESTDTTLIISSSAGITKIQGQSSDEYPPFPNPGGEDLTLSVSDITTIDTMVRFSAGVDPTRMVLTSLLFQFLPEGLRVVGTDGFRLAILTLPQLKNDSNQQLLVPAKAIAEVTRIATQEKLTQIAIRLSQELKQLSFMIGETEVFVRLIEGDFPPFEKIMPTEFSIQAEWDGEAFLAQLKRALIFARDASHIVRLQLSNKELKIQAQSSSVGEYTGSIPLETHQGGEAAIAFNARYLLEFMTTLKPDRVWFGMNESLKPAVLRPAGKTEYTYVVMPFRVNE